MAQYNELVNRLQNQIVQLKQEHIEKDINQMKQPIKQFYEDKKQQDSLVNYKNKIFEHFKNEYNLVN